MSQNPPNAASVWPSQPSGRIGFFLAFFVLLHLSHPLTWQIGLPGVWFPALGVGMLLVAWLGPWAAVLVALDTYLQFGQCWLLNSPSPWEYSAQGLLACTWSAVIFGCEVVAAWYCFRDLALGSRRLNDPRSATLFIFIIPFLTIGLFAVVGQVPGLLAEPSEHWPVIGQYWLSRALGIMAIAPPFLVLLTPWLVRRGWAVPERIASSERPTESLELTWGNCIELAGLSIGTTILGLLLVVAQWKEVPATWYVWILSLSLIIWASLRQGVRGGVLAASTATAACMIAVIILEKQTLLVLPLQYYLAAECCTGLLVGASCSWIQGNRFRTREIAEHIPVVLYSARFLSRDKKTIAAKDAEITYVSPASRQLLHRRPDEMLGGYQHWIDRVHPEDRELFQAALAQLVRHKEPVTFEYRLFLEEEPYKTQSDWVVFDKEAQPPASMEMNEPKITYAWVRDTFVPIADADHEVRGWEGVIVDITEQRTLADSLRRTSGMFHSLIANLPAGVFFVQAPNGKPILLNARARELLGQREDPTARMGQWAQVYRLRRPDGTLYPEQELPVFKALRQGTTSMCDDIVVYRRDGRKIPLVTWAAPINLRGQGSPDGAVWVLEDLTALRQAEAAHRESEARLRTVIETMAEGLIVYDRRGSIVECNPAACSILGRTLDQLKGRSVKDPDWSYLREDGKPLPAEEHPALVSLRSGEPVRDLVLGIPRTGKSGVRPNLRSQQDFPDMATQTPARWLLVNAMPLSDPRNPVPNRVVTTITDITAQRYALEVLRASEERYRELVETMPMMLMQSDRQGKVTYLNPAVSDITGYEWSDFEQLGAWKDFVHPEDSAEIQAAREATLEGRNARLEIRFRAKDKSEMVGYAMFQPLWRGREVVGLTCLIVDMTLQRRLEQELQRTQRLDLVGRLAGGIAHDFNNILAVILSLAELVRETLPPEHPAYADINGILDATNQAAQLAGQLLTFSKQRKVVAKKVNFAATARRTLDLLRSTLPSRIEVELSLDNSDLHVMADETQLQQVLMNLCLNARDAMPEGGQLQVRLEQAALQELNGSAQRTWVKLSVRDTGQGMSESVRARVFDPFFSTKAHGTGLGLAVVQQIVESYGGRIDVQSQPSAGSCFEIWMPRSGDT